MTTTNETPRAGAERRVPRGLVVAAVVSGLVMLVSGLVILTADDGDGTSPVVGSNDAAAGEAAPAAEFFTFDGEPTTLADLGGTPLVVNFFASWCGPCVEEMPVFERVSNDLGDRVQFIGVNESSDRPEDGQAIVEDTGVSYPVFRDDTGDLFRGFEAIGMPTTAFVAADGTVVDVHSGILVESELRRKLAALTTDG